MSASILVPTDGSPESEQALDMAVPLARALSLSIVLFWSWEGLGETAPGTSAKAVAQIETQEIADRTATLSEIADRRLLPLSLLFETKVGRGPAAAAILRQADLQEPRFIVFSAHGRSGLKRWRLGSVADRLVRESAYDTVIVTPKIEVSLYPEIGRILVALDGSERAEHALDTALMLARASGATLHLVRAIALRVPAAPLGAEIPYREVTEDLVTAAAAYLRELAALIPDVRVSTEVQLGGAGQAILDSAVGADLVTMTPHAGSGVATVLGSTTDAVIRGCTKPVLIVRT